MGHQIVSCRAQLYWVHPKGPSHGLTQAFPGNWTEWGGPSQPLGWGLGVHQGQKDKADAVWPWLFILCWPWGEGS